MKKWQNILILIVVSSAISLLSGALNWVNQFVICGIVYFVAGLIYSRKYPISRFLYGIIVVAPFLLTYSLLVVWEGLSHVYPIALVPVVSIATGLILNEVFFRGMSKSALSLFISLAIVVILLLGYIGMPNWLSYTLHPGNTSSIRVPAIQLYDENGNAFNLNAKTDKIIVLDFWTTSCGVCFKEFPNYEALKQQYSERKDIVFYAVNLIHRKEQLSKVKRVTNELPYSFEHLYSDINSVKQIRDSLGISMVPQIVIINKQSEVIYIGSLNAEKHILVNNFHDLINSIK